MPQIPLGKMLAEVSGKHLRRPIAGDIDPADGMDRLFFGWLDTQGECRTETEFLQVGDRLCIP